MPSARPLPPLPWLSARPLLPLPATHLGCLTSDLPILGPLVNHRFTSPPWCFALVVMLLSAGYGTGAPYRHSLFRSLMTSVGLIALFGANINAMRMLLTQLGWQRVRRDVRTFPT